MAAFAIQGIPGVVAYLRPSHARPDAPMLMVKRPSFPKGTTPPKLVAFAGQCRAAPVACKGRKAQGYRECLIKETKGQRGQYWGKSRPRARKA
jgi:hypothetical protein